ncbi:zinc finger, CCHC-type containing protein [Tanacetum coccineum]|uniref:Zinc finger, CCHC-type containing protein n=1 Tax=Tanacetum coccineum TaxID=301880 RepID=A0ABQ5GBD9_9ASTR
MKVDGTIDKFKARLVIQGFKQKEGIDYFDTYDLVARISTIRLLIALVATYNLVIHQMDVKTSFLNGDLEEEVYMKQLEGFIMSENEHKVCKLIKSLYGLKHTSKQWHQKFDEVVLSSGFVLNQSDKTDQDQVDKMKYFLSSNFSMKDMGRLTAVDQFEYFKVIGCLMYAMTSTRPNVDYFVGKLSRSYFYNWLGVLLGGGAISWASKKQTCITDSTIKAKFVALAAAGKEVEWLRNLIYEIPL